MRGLEYRIGRLVLQPHRQLLDAGAPVAIGRRALDLLSVLAKAEGGLVTKDELVQAVWPNCVVEDNAIQAQIVAARKALGDESERLSTVRGLGYRVAAAPGIIASPPQPQEPPPPAAIEPPVQAARGNVGQRTIGIAAVALLLIAIATAALLGWRLQPRAVDSVSLQPFDTAGQPPLARNLAASLNYEVGNALSNASVKVLGPAPPGRGDGTLVLGGRIQVSGADLHLTATLENPADRAVLWSTSFTRPSAEAAAMQEQVAQKLADVLHCALDTTSHPNGRADLATMRLYLRACDLEHEPNSSGQVRDLYRQIVARHPAFSAAWSRLAYSSALAAFEMAPEQAASARREARLAADTALRLNPRDGLAYEAMADIGLGRLRYDQLYGLFSRGLSVQPDRPEILQDQGQLLLRMGRIQDALAELRLANDLQPTSLELQADLMQATVAADYVDDARGIAERALRIWPDDHTLNRRRFMIELRYGDPAAARALMAAPAARTFGLSETDKKMSDLLLTMREHHGLGAQDLVRLDLAAYGLGGNNLGHVILDLSQAGAVDEAFRLADSFAVSGHSLTTMTDPEFLWEPGTEALRRDPRFITLAAKLGIAEFWRRTGKWPDFCAAPGWPYDCRTTAAAPPPLVRGGAAIGSRVH